MFQEIEVSLQGKVHGWRHAGCSRSDCFVKDLSGNIFVREEALNAKLSSDVTDEQPPAVDL